MLDAGITAAAGTRLALQLFLVKGFRLEYILWDQDTPMKRDQDSLMYMSLLTVQPDIQMCSYRLEAGPPCLSVGGVWRPKCGHNLHSEMTRAEKMLHT